MNESRKVLKSILWGVVFSAIVTAAYFVAEFWQFERGWKSNVVDVAFPFSIPSFPGIFAGMVTVHGTAHDGLLRLALIAFVVNAFFYSILILLLLPLVRRLRSKASPAVVETQ